MQFIRSAHKISIKPYTRKIISLTTIVLTLFSVISGTVSAAAAAPPAGNSPIQATGYHNVFLYPPALTIQVKGPEFLQYTDNQTPWIASDNENQVLADDMAVLKELSQYPAAQGALQNVNIYIFPVTNFPAGLQGENSATEGLTIPPVNSGGSYEIWVGLCPPAVLAHELGHVLHDKLLAADVYNWTNVNVSGQSYLSLHHYNPDFPLDAAGQAQLPWKQRIAEWFAEDTGAFLVPSHNSVCLPGGYQDARIKGFMAALFAAGTATDPDIAAAKIIPGQAIYYLGVRQAGSNNVVYQAVYASRPPQTVAGACYAPLDVLSTLLGSSITYDPLRGIFGSLVLSQTPAVAVNLDEDAAQKIINNNDMSAMPLCNVVDILKQHGWTVTWDGNTLSAEKSL